MLSLFIYSIVTVFVIVGGQPTIDGDYRHDNRDELIDTVASLKTQLAELVEAKVETRAQLAQLVEAKVETRAQLANVVADNGALRAKVATLEAKVTGLAAKIGTQFIHLSFGSDIVVTRFTRRKDRVTGLAVLQNKCKQG